MGRFTVSLGQCSFCGRPAGRTSRLVGDPSRRERICRSCTLLLTGVPAALPVLDELPEPEIERDVAPDDGEQRPVGELLREFRKAVDAEIGIEDADARQNLGVAYFEMGLLDEAIAEFELAARDAARRAECLALIGMTFRVRGDADRSIESLTAALKTPGVSERQKAAFFYELSLALDAADEPAKARQARAQAGVLDRRFEPERPATPRYRELSNAREAFASGGSRDAFRFSRESEPERPAAFCAALEATLRTNPDDVRARITLARLSLATGRRVHGAHHFLLAGVLLREAGDPVHAMAAFQACARAGSPSASPIARRALAELHGEALPVEEARTQELERFVCSFCDTDPDFLRPFASGENVVICSQCLALARTRFSE